MISLFYRFKNIQCVKNFSFYNNLETEKHQKVIYWCKQSISSIIIKKSHLVIHNIQVKPTVFSSIRKKSPINFLIQDHNIQS